MFYYKSAFWGDAIFVKSLGTRTLPLKLKCITVNRIYSLFIVIQKVANALILILILILGGWGGVGRGRKRVRNPNVFKGGTNGRSTSKVLAGHTGPGTSRPAQSTAGDIGRNQEEFVGPRS